MSISGSQGLFCNNNTNLTISGNFFKGFPNQEAITLLDVDSSLIVNNSIINCSINGIHIINSDFNVFINNTISREKAPINTGYRGIYIVDSINNTIEDNIFHQKGNYGVQLDYASYNNTITNNSFYTFVGVPVGETNGAYDNHIFDNHHLGIAEPPLFLNNSQTITMQPFRVEWTSIPRADSYELYYWWKPSFAWNLVKIGDFTTTHANISLPMNLKTYNLTLKSVNSYGASGYSDHILIYLDLVSNPPPASPSFITQNQTINENTILIEWEPVDFVDHYEIYMKTGDQGNFNLLKSSSGHNLTIKFNATNTYFFYLVAVNGSGSSNPSEVLEIDVNLGTNDNGPAILGYELLLLHIPMVTIALYLSLKKKVKVVS